MTTSAPAALIKQHNPAFQLAGLAALLIVGYMGRGVLRFTFGPLNSITGFAYRMIPLFAIRPVLRLRRPFKILGMIILTPLLLLLLLSIPFKVLGGREHIEPLQTFQIGSSTVQLERYDYGGGVGVHGLNLEQQRLILPGVYLARSIDFFDSALEATLSLEGPSHVRVRGKGNYYSYDHVIDRAYLLKSWVYF